MGFAPGKSKAITCHTSQGLLFSLGLPARLITQAASTKKKSHQ
jgi:hypothetical protein